MFVVYSNRKKANVDDVTYNTAEVSSEESGITVLDNNDVSEELEDEIDPLFLEYRDLLNNVIEGSEEAYFKFDEASDAAYAVCDIDNDRVYEVFLTDDKTSPDHKYQIFYAGEEGIVSGLTASAYLPNYDFWVETDGTTINAFKYMGSKGFRTEFIIENPQNEGHEIIMKDFIADLSVGEGSVADRAAMGKKKVQTRIITREYLDDLLAGQVTEPETIKWIPLTVETVKSISREDVSYKYVVPPLYAQISERQDQISPQEPSKDEKKETQKRDKAAIYDEFPEIIDIDYEISTETEYNEKLKKYEEEKLLVLRTLNEQEGITAGFIHTESITEEAIENGIWAGDLVIDNLDKIDHYYVWDNRGDFVYEAFVRDGQVYYEKVFND